jgi:hypothetical protein
MHSTFLDYFTEMYVSGFYRLHHYYVRFMILRINVEYFHKQELTGIFNGPAEIVCDVGIEF